MSTNPKRPANLRSAVTNGTKLVAGDGRSLWARRMRDLLDMHLADLGGPDAVSEAERSICRRASVLEVELERMEARFAEMGADDGQIDLYGRTAGNLRRLFEAIGLQRRARDVTPDLKSYLARADSGNARDSFPASPAVEHRADERPASGRPNGFTES